MAEMNNRIHSLGSGNPHHHHVPNHTRPFFCVQPPSQPFYMYQWNVNMNPCGRHVAALPHVSPYMAPYPYMSGYPRYVMPQAPIYPVDCRRIFNAHLSSSPAYDVHLRQHYNHIARETASSEVQTDQTDPLTKLIGSLDRLKTSEIAEKEDKGPVTSDMKPLPLEMVTQSSFDIGEVNETELKLLVQRRLPITRQTMAQPDGHISHQPHRQPLLQPITNDSTTREVSTTGSILSSLVEASQALKSEANLCDKAQYDSHSVVSGIDILPLDSSSVNGEEDVEYCLEAFCPVSKNMEDFEKSETLCLDLPIAEKNPNRASTEDEMLDAARYLRKDLQQNQKLHHAGTLELMNGKSNPGMKAEEDLPYHILRLPCDKVTTGMLQQDKPLWFIDLSTSMSLPPQSYPLASSSSTDHSYYPHPTIQVAMEHQSILSPFKDEQSSKEKLFSTQLHNNVDNDLIVRGCDLLSSEPVYVGEGKMAANQEAHNDFGKENCIQLVAKLASEWSKMCLQSCACCGTSLGENNEGMAFRGKKGGGIQFEYLERPDEAEQVEMEYREEEAAAEMFEGPEVLGSCLTPGQQQHHHDCYSSTRALPHASHPTLHLYPRRRSSKICDCKEHEGMEEMLAYDEQQGYDQGPHYRAAASVTSKTNKFKGKRQRNPPARTCNVCLQSKRSSCKTFVQQTPRRADHDYKESEVSHSYRSRGSTKRRSTRY